ncbi:MAG: Ig-like domain-containing protein, partial [Chloroflexota bacterium]|nr:Ig-like domain-containing protein [Chloroflexota bacterium]
VDGDMFTFSIVGGAAHGQVQLLDATAGTFTYQPTPGFLGADSFTFNATDGLTISNQATLTVNVTNSAPVATEANAAVHLNRTFSGTLSASDADGDPLTFSIVGGAAHGQVQLLDAATGAFTYQPASGFLGGDQFSFKVSDGTLESNLATVQLRITNTAPVAIADSLSAAIKATTIGQLKATDADSDPLIYSIVANPQQGVVVITNAATGAFTYTPTTEAHGSDSFSFKVNDGSTDSNVAVVTLALGNATPIANSVTFNIGLKGGLSTGRLHASDADGDPLRYNTIDDAKHGHLSINATTGEFTYTPNTSFKDGDSFQFNVYDGKVYSNIATVTIIARPFTVYLPLVRRK